MTALIQPFVDDLLPVLICASTGFVLGRSMKPDIRTASRLVFYIFAPCLVFVSLAHVRVSGAEFGQLGLFTFAVCAVMGTLAFLLGRMLGVGRQIIASLVISSVLINSGNYGLAATKFAFGNEALARALVCFVSSTAVTYTAGILIASMGKLPLPEALRKLLEVPAFYGLIAAGFVRYGSLPIPLFVDRAVTLLSDASIPLMLVVLGLQIAGVRTWPRGRVALIGAATFLQLVVTPLVALLMAKWLGMSGLTRQAAVLQASMPAAVVTTILAVEYDLDATLVTGTVLLTTLLSPLTLTPLIAYLRASG